MNTVWIKRATLVLSGQVCENGAVAVENGKIVFLGQETEPQSRAQPPAGHERAEFDLDGDILIPGLIDTHVHGAGGFDVMDGTEASLNALRYALLYEGTTAFLPTTMSRPPDELQRVLANLRTAENRRDTLSTGAEILGVHLEGPFLSARYPGAQAPESILPVNSGRDLEIVERLITLSPQLIRILTLAPERPEARKLITVCLKNQIIPSVGHSGADYEQMQQAIALGVHHITHAFNAMPGIHHRQPGLLTAALLDPCVQVELIADGVHIHPAVLDLALRLKPPGAVCLVSDGTRAVGKPDGIYELGGQKTIVKQGTIRLLDGTIAGSAYPLLQGVRTLVFDLKRSLAEAVRYATLNPARLLGVEDRLGSLEVGKEATFIRLSSDLQVKQVWMKGILVVERG